MLGAFIINVMCKLHKKGFKKYYTNMNIKDKKYLKKSKNIFKNT